MRRPCSALCGSTAHTVLVARRHCSRQHQHCERYRDTTFVNGWYQSARHGNHAPFYINQKTHGIIVMDQRRSNKTKPKVSRRLIPFLGKDPNGNYKKPSDNGDAFQSSSKTAIVSSLLAVAFASSAGETAAPTVNQRTVSVACPARIVVTQTAQAVPGWEAGRDPSPNRLDSYGFYDGPIAEMAELKPDRSQKRGHLTTEEWRFIQPQGRIYVACRYQGTDYRLSRPLPLGTHACSARSDDMKPQTAEDVITCR